MKFTRICAGLLSLCLLAAALPAEKVSAQEKEAWELSEKALVAETEHMNFPAWMFDGDRIHGQKTGSNASMTLYSPEGFGSLYLIFDTQSGPYTLISGDTGKKVTCGEAGFLHDYLDMEALLGEIPQTVTLQFGEDPVKINELRAFTEGEPPKDVQRWKQAPEDGVDLMLFSAHGDDEQLFFAGVLPYYAGELGYEVQLVYSTSHANYGPRRSHEMLDGLWVSGVKNYPVFGPFDDYFTKTAEQARKAFEDRGIPSDQVQAFVVEQLRRYKPLVVLGHDVNGEYGHGMHQLFSQMVQTGVEVSMDSQQYPESADRWGTWDVPKTYLHLYPEGAIHMNWDIPLESFGGMTAYEVTKEYGFPAHESQYDDFAWYMRGMDQAEDITTNGPCDFGLYRTTVGPDVEKNDFFENLTNRAEQKRLEEEKRLQAEKEARQKAEEEAARAEAEKQAEEERIQAEQLALQQAQVRRNRILAATVIVLVLLVLTLLVVIFRRKSKK